MIEQLEGRRLLAIVRPDTAFGESGVLPMPPKWIAGQADWTVQVLDAQPGGTITALATTGVRIPGGHSSRSAASSTIPPTVITCPTRKPHL